ncbi:MAG: PAS domain S-box protein, partial [Desulfobacterota bacterium]|nr:PAS domain S-box protein [Thermodesulfobacteriota bacterium]
MLYTDKFTSKELGRPAGAGAQRLREKRVRSLVEERDLCDSSPALERQVQVLTQKLFEAHEALRREAAEKRQKEDASWTSELKYRNILESIEDGYFEVDLQGNLIFFNEGLCRITGYPSEELHGMNNRDYMSEETSGKVFETFNQVFRTGEAAKVLGWELIRKDSEKRYVETSISLVRNPRGEPAGFRGIARDITGVKRLEKAKERAIHHLSHELGTPLSILEGVLRRIPEDLKKGNIERIYEAIERGKRSVKRLTGLQTKMNDILNERPVQEKEKILYLLDAAIAFLDDLGEESLQEGAEAVRRNIIKRLDSLQKVEEGQTEPIALDAFTHRICEEARVSMKGRQLEIVEKIDVGPCAEMDPKVLKKVCEGFLKNAIENTPDEGRIEIELRR